jgi:DNA recombination protein RmuC
MAEGMQLDWVVVAAGVIALVAVMVALASFMRLGAVRDENTRLNDERNRDRTTAGTAITTAEKYLGERAEAIGRLREAEARIAELRAEREAAWQRVAEVEAAREAAQREADLARQYAAEMVERVADRETAQQDAIKDAKAAVLASATELSSKLLDDHKRENEEAKKAVEEKTQAIAQQFETVVKSVASLADQTNAAKQTAETVWRALSTPAAAGQFSEITLENTLKSFGLARDRDFVIQASLNGENGRLRPDAMIFLPNDAVLVIDSKASKFLLELAEVEGTEREREVAAALARTMLNHVRALCSKDYRGGIRAAYCEAGRGAEVSRVLCVMYLQSDAALGKLAAADSEFIKTAQREQIVVAGPSALAGVLLYASMDIGLGRQAENQEKIVEETRALLDGVSMALGHAEGVGKALKQAAGAYVKFAGSVNARLLPRARKIGQLGVQPTKSRSLPSRFGSFELVEPTGNAVIEGESEELQQSLLSRDQVQ